MVIGIAGFPLSKSGEEGFKFLKENGIPHIELQFTRNFPTNIIELKQFAEKYDILLTIHAPYYINLNSESEEIIERSKERLIKSCKIADFLNAKYVVFHPGYYGIKSKKETFETIVNNLKPVVDEISSYNVILSPETTGKLSSFGSLEETFDLCKKLDLVPTIDFAHIYARSLGEINNTEQFMEIVDRYYEEFGETFHFHFSDIKYGPKGEIAHLPLGEGNFNYKGLAEVIKDLKDYIGTCESPLLEYDAIKFVKLINPL